MPPRKSATNPNGIAQTLDMIRQHESLLGPDERAMLTALAESLGQRAEKTGNTWSSKTVWQVAKKTKHVVTWDAPSRKNNIPKEAPETMTVARCIEMIRRKEIVGYVAGVSRNDGQRTLADLWSGVEIISNYKDPEKDRIQGAYYNFVGTNIYVQDTAGRYPDKIIVHAQSYADTHRAYFTLVVSDCRYDKRPGWITVIVLAMPHDDEHAEANNLYRLLHGHTFAHGLFETILREGGEGTRHLLGATDRTVGVHMVQ